MKKVAEYIHPKNGNKYDVIVGKLDDKPCVAGGTSKAINNRTYPKRIFLHAGELSPSGLSWLQEPGGWVLEYPDRYQNTDSLDGCLPPVRLLKELAELR